VTLVATRRAETLRASLQRAAELVKDGLALPARPRGNQPDLYGADLSDLSDHDLIRKMTLFARWADYSGGQLAVAEVDEKYAQELLDRLTAMGLVEAAEPAEEERGPRGGAPRSGGITVGRARKKLDPVYKDAKDAHLAAYAGRKLIAAIHAALERDAALCSRELTRRTDRSGVERRTVRGES
jgi:hypothetical protein